ncbi:MAG: dihydropteroate synthase [Deltaproteobacteria bacterium]|nr:dihydropteroate synthase [Deltaproteobacteria bacterium]
MGILNVTPDSFSDGGLYLDKDRAVERGLGMVRAGADIIDVGGESTRPGSKGVGEAEEKRRVLPVIEELSSRTDAVISIDTVKPDVAREATRLGARLINDVSMLRYSDDLARVAAESGADIVLMHSRKTPKDMQDEIVYNDVVQDVIDELLEAAACAETAGIERSRIWLDPGMGFAKTAKDNIELLARLPELVTTGFPVLVGPSRKSFIGKLTDSDVDDRLGGSAAAVTAATMAGAAAVRVHDVAVMHQAATIAHMIAECAVEKNKQEIDNA